MKTALFILSLLAATYLFSNCTKEDSLPDTGYEFDVPVSGKPQSVSEIMRRSYQSPKSPYGVQPVIDFRVNTTTIDVLWIEADGNRHISRISLSDRKLVEEITIPAKANAKGRFLGFESLGNDKFIIGYSATNSHGDANAEAWYTAFDKSGKELFSTRIFGEVNQKLVNSKGSPAQAGTAVIRYNSADNVIAIYLAHTMLWDDKIRHQGGWIGFLDASTGELLKKENKVIGNGWFYSHNFSQRCIVSSENKFYTLSHGDAYPRALGLTRWSHTNGKEKGLEYYKIQNGTTGNNTTLTTTGDFVELSDGKVAIAYSTEDGRNERDLRVAIIDGMKGDEPQVISETWLTENSSEYVGWGTKIGTIGDNLLVGWNSFNENAGVGTKFILLNALGEKVSELESMNEAVLPPGQSFRHSAEGKHLMFVSAGEGNSLHVHLFGIEN